MRKRFLFRTVGKGERSIAGRPDVLQTWHLSLKESSFDRSPETRLADTPCLSRILVSHPRSFYSISILCLGYF